MRRLRIQEVRIQRAANRGESALEAEQGSVRRSQLQCAGRPSALWLEQAQGKAHKTNTRYNQGADSGKAHQRAEVTKGGAQRTKPPLLGAGRKHKNTQAYNSSDAPAVTGQSYEQRWKPRT